MKGNSSAHIPPLLKRSDVFKYMYNFLHEWNLIYKYQSVFQLGHSTIYQIIEIYDNICKALEYMCMFL